MGQNSTEVAYGFGQLGSAHMHNDNGEDLTPPEDMVIVAITMLDDTVFDKLTADTSNEVVYGVTRTNNIYFGIANANTGGNGEAVDTGITFPKGLTIYGRWTAVSLNAAQTAGGIICYFGK